MKHNWEYKKLGDICSIVGRIGFRGYTREDLVEKGNGAISLSPSNIIDGKLNFDDKVSYLSWEKYFESPEIMLAEGDVVFTKTASIGKCALVKHLPVETTLNPQLVVLKNIQCDSSYLTYMLQDKRFQEAVLSKKGGTSIPTISQAFLGSLPVPVPPIETQKQIVAELDKINETIEDCRELLRNLDALAQSLFYDTFGDPITNSKGWEIKPLKDAVIEMFLGPFGSALKTDCYVPEEDSFAMVYEQKHAIKKTLAQENNFINEDKFFALKRFEVLPFDFIMSCRGTIGQLYQVPENAPRGIIHPSVMKIRLNSSTYGSVFFKFLLPIIIKEQQTKGNCVQMAITAKELGAKKLPVPPFSLQEKFADRIEQIEAQKKVLENTIAELQTLLDSRMDYWFN